jgi:hypothetical protein
MLVPLLAVYLLGVCLGFVFTAIVCLGVGLFHQLYHTGFGSKRSLFSNPDAWATNGSTVVALLIGWGLFWLHSSSREQAHSGEPAAAVHPGLHDEEGWPRLRTAHQNRA